MSKDRNEHREILILQAAEENDPNLVDAMTPDEKAQYDNYVKMFEALRGENGGSLKGIDIDLPYDYWGVDDDMAVRFSQNPITGKVECYNENGVYKGDIITTGDELEWRVALYGDVYDLPHPKQAIEKLMSEGFFEAHPECRSKLLTKDGKPRSRRPKQTK